MQTLSPDGRRIVDDLAQRHGFSPDAVTALLAAVAAGNGFQAQFNHPEFGGMGQWSQGGMIMIGDMFNQGLKYRVGALCDELSGLLRNQPFFAAPSQSQTQSQGGGSFQSQGGGSFQTQGAGSGVSLFVPGSDPNNWWPAELGSPSATGAQNDLRYAFFPGARRLALRIGGETRIYDSGDHAIGGFSQQQSGDQSLSFTSQFGLVRVSDLPLVSPAAQISSPPEPPPTAPAAFAPPPPAPPTQTLADDIFALIEKLAALKEKNILTDEEFAAKKTELLSRL